MPKLFSVYLEKEYIICIHVDANYIDQPHSRASLFRGFIQI